MSEPLLPPAQLKVYAVHHGRLPGWKNPPLRVVIDHTRVDAALVDFPVLLALSAAAGTTRYDCSSVFAELGSAANRKRIAVTTADGVTQCYVEIKEWDHANLRAYLWIRVPYISPGTDTALFLYADATHADNGGFVGDTGEPAAQRVWANGFTGVWLKPSAGRLLDSTANANHATIYGAVETDGPLGRSLSFDGVDDYVAATSAAPPDPSSGSASVWFERTWPTNDGTTHGLMCIGGFVTGSHQDYKRLQMFKYSSNLWYLRLGSESSFNQITIPDSEIPPNTLTNITMTWGGETVSVYVNGSLAGTFNQVAPLAWNTEAVEIGRSYQNHMMVGRILVTHLSASRSSAWIAAANAALRDELISFGPEDPPFVLQAVLDSYTYFAWRRRWREPDEFELSINRYAHGAEELSVGRLVVLRRDEEYRVGIIETRDLQLDATGRPSEIWKITGRDLGAMLSDPGRIALEGTDTGTGYDTRTGAAETLMRHYVEVNCISPSNADRLIPFLHLESVDRGRGGSTTYSARFTPITQILGDLCLTSGLGWDIVIEPEAWRLVFRVRQGVDRRTSQSTNPQILFSPALGNALVTGYHESRQQTVSVAIMAGQGEAAAREVVEVGAGTGFARLEGFCDARDLDTAEALVERGTQRLVEFSDEISLEMELLPGSAFRYLRDFDLGDLVYAEYPGVASTESRIIEILEEWTSTGPRVGFVLGKEFIDLYRVTKWQNRRVDAEVRR